MITLTELHTLFHALPQNVLLILPKERDLIKSAMDRCCSQYSIDLPHGQIFAKDIASRCTPTAIGWANKIRSKSVPIYTLEMIVALAWDQLACVTHLFLYANACAAPTKYTKHLQLLQRECSSYAKLQFAWRQRVMKLDVVVWQACSDLIVMSLPSPSDSAERLKQISLQDCCQHIAVQCASAFMADLDESLLADLIAPLCVLVSPPSLFVAQTVCRSAIMTEAIGVALQKMLMKFVHAEEFGSRLNLGVPGRESCVVWCIVVIAVITQFRTRSCVARLFSLCS